MKFTVSSIPVETVFDGLIFPKTLLSPANLENPTVDDCFRLVEQNRKLLKKNKSIMLKGFNLSTAEDFSRVIHSTGWEEFGYRGAVVRTSPAKRVSTGNEAPIDWNIGFHHEMALIAIRTLQLQFLQHRRCGAPLPPSKTPSPALPAPAATTSSHASSSS